MLLALVSSILSEEDTHSSPKPIAGGMADVYRGNDMLERGRDVAVKIFRKASLEPEIIIAAFRRETRALTDLKHPSIVELYDSGLDTERDSPADRRGLHSPRQKPKPVRRPLPEHLPR
jgi:serine/threonine protein kinase